MYLYQYVETVCTSHLSKIPDLDEPQPAQQLCSLVVKTTGQVHQHSKDCTLSGYEEMVCDKALNLASKVPHTEQVSARELE